MMRRVLRRHDARPALQQLLADITVGRVDIVVVYKIDRLTRSLADFAKIVEILDARERPSCRDAAVQHDDLDGALDPQRSVVLRQFEREVIGERIRDKIAASKRKGMWMGGAAARLSSAGPQARRRRQRGGNRALHFSPPRRTRLCPVVEGRAGSPGIQSKLRTSASGRISGGKPFAPVRST